jgi:hypothetical protein
MPAAPLYLLFSGSSYGSDRFFLSPLLALGDIMSIADGASVLLRSFLDFIWLQPIMLMFMLEFLLSPLILTLYLLEELWYYCMSWFLRTSRLTFFDCFF